MAEDLRRQAAEANALAQRLAYQEGLRCPPCRQKVLLTGMDCLAGQEDLFATDGPPDVVYGDLGRAAGDWPPNACPLETPGKAGRAPL